jgi:hypothetical protein
VPSGGAARDCRTSGTTLTRDDLLDFHVSNTAHSFSLRTALKTAHLLLATTFEQTLRTRSLTCAVQLCRIISQTFIRRPPTRSPNPSGRSYAVPDGATHPLRRANTNLRLNVTRRHLRFSAIFPYQLNPAKAAGTASHTRSKKEKGRDLRERAIDPFGDDYAQCQVDMSLRCSCSSARF